MTTPNDCAFPADKNTDTEGGLTKREHFAALAMQSLIGLQQTDENGKVNQVWWIGQEHDREKLADLACKLSDALISELNK